MNHGRDHNNENKELVEQVLQEVQVKEVMALYNFMSVWNTSNSMNEVSRRLGKSIEWLYDASQQYVKLHPIYLKALEDEDMEHDDEEEPTEEEKKKIQKLAREIFDWKEGDPYIAFEQAMCMKRWTGATATPGTEAPR